MADSRLIGKEGLTTPTSIIDLLDPPSRDITSERRRQLQRRVNCSLFCQPAIQVMIWISVSYTDDMHIEMEASEWG